MAFVGQSEYNIKMDFKETECEEDVGWIHLAKGRFYRIFLRETGVG
jgi:hypothetical protein